MCHSECLPEAGCWGPGPAMCARCCTFEADGVCVSDCSEAPGFYLPPSSAVSALTSQFRCHTLPLSVEQVAQMQEEEVLAAIRPAIKCARCHEECAESCTAPGPDQCLGECKHFKVRLDRIYRVRRNVLWFWVFAFFSFSTTSASFCSFYFTIKISVSFWCGSS